MIFELATITDIPIIRHLANEIWWPTYKNVISDEQISFMLEKMYSEEALQQQMSEGMQFHLAKIDDEPIAFAGHCKDGDDYKLHKIYLLPQTQGKGLGRKIIEQISEIARQNEASWLKLNVNRDNPALHFYKKLGFDIYETVDIPYFEFVMNDYVMRKPL